MSGPVSERDQYILRKMKVVARRLVPEYVAANLEVNFFAEYMGETLAYELRSHVLAESIGTREYPVFFSCPSSWWQHFKRDVLHMSHKTTIETKVVKGLGYRGYPHAPIALPAQRMGEAIVFETFELKQ